MLIGVALWLFIMRLFNLSVPVLTYGFIVFGSLLPDICKENSILGRYFIPFNIILMEHRGFTHSLIGALVLSIPFVFFGRLYAIGVLFGYVLHLICDCFTKRGVRLLLPFSDFRFRCRWIEYGDCMEEYAFMGLALLYIFK